MHATSHLRLRQILFLGLILIAPVHAAEAQTPPAISVVAEGQVQELVLRDGTRALGRVEKIENGVVTFRTASGGMITVDLTQVISANVTAGRLVGDGFWPADSNPTRLFFAPTGRALKRGQAYVGVYEFFMPFAQYGVTDRLSVGGGTPLFVGTGSHPIWFTPKLLLASTPDVQVSIGAMHFLNTGDATFGVAYAAMTAGSTDSAVTIGVGQAYAREGRSSGSAFVLMVGGEHRFSRRLKFVTENYVIEGHTLITGGLRVLGDRLSADLGWFMPVDSNEWMAVPMFNFVWRVGR